MKQEELAKLPHSKFAMPAPNLGFANEGFGPSGLKILRESKTDNGVFNKYELDDGGTFTADAGYLAVCVKETADCVHIDDKGKYVINPDYVFTGVSGKGWIAEPRASE
jgi:hypothetical protein